MDPTRLADLAQGGNFCIDTSLGRIDIMQWASGIEADNLYDELDQAAIAGDIDGITVRVCGLEHLRAIEARSWPSPGSGGSRAPRSLERLHARAHT